MNTMETARIPIALVTGFLGSGKTTYLQHVARQLSDRPVLYIVNEFSPVDVDGTLIDAPGGRLVPISGGSIFCLCKVTDFVNALDEAAAAAESNPIDGVVVEASGMANPGVAREMLAGTKRDDRFRLGRIVTIVEPGRFPKVLRTLASVRAQVESADVVLVNKCDVFDEEQVAATEELVRGINPGVRIVRTTRSRADVDLFTNEADREIHGEFAQCRDPNFDQVVARFDGGITRAELERLLLGAGDDLYRAKGYGIVDGERALVDYSASGLAIEPRAGTVDGRGLVLIGRGDARERIAALAAEIERHAAGC